MKNQQQHYIASMDLKDGHTILSTWIQSFDRRPQLDDAVKIPVHFQTALAGFAPTAVITRIETGGPLPDKIELEAITQVKREDRPRVVLNSVRIARPRRAEAERYLRSCLEFPLIFWETGKAPDPVVRFHDPATGRKSCPAGIQSGLRDLLCQPVSAL